MRKTARYLASLAWLALLATGAGAQTTGKIAGTVVDAAGEPLIGVNIRVEGTTRGGITDVEGRYFILNVSPGEYVLVASYVGFQTVRTTGVRVQVDRTTTVDFEMQEEAVGMDEVTIVAERSLVEIDRTSASAKVTGEQILTLPVDNFLETVSLQAGVTRGAGGSLHIRGGRSSEIKYYVDGVAVSNPFSNNLAAPVENTAVQEVEVISGTFNAEFGQANSGIVNIVTKDGTQEFSGTFVGSVGGYFSDRDDIFYDIGEASATGERRVEGSLSGPTGIPRLTFFANLAYTDLDGSFLGQRAFNIGDRSDFSGGDPDQWTLVATGDSAFVPMSPSSGFTTLGKLTYQLTDNVKVSYSLTRNFFKNKGYSHFFRLNPDHRPWQRSLSFNHLLALNHVLNPRTFYNLRLTAYTTSLERWRYENPLDPRYANAFGAGNQPANVFNTGGVDTYYLDRSSETYALRFDITRQIGNAHLVKAGVEYRRNLLRFEDFIIDVRPDDDGIITPRIPDLSSTNHDRYRRTPVEAAAFIQDKIEIDDLVVNAGLRFDYFDPNAVVPTNLTDPANVRGLTPEGEVFEDASTKLQVSPRLGLAFPISEQGVLHASYGQFFQIPPLQQLYENPDFEILGGGDLSIILGNADLEAQRSTVYEIGLQQQLTANFVVDVTGYYRDVRNLLGTEIQEAFNGTRYGRYINTDFGNVRGITTAFSFVFPDAGLRGGINYTFQSARGNGSDPNQTFLDAQGNNEATRVLIPLDWDQRHNVTADVALRRDAWTLGLIGEFISGYPFTPLDVNRIAIVEERNQARYDPEVRLDLRIGYRLTLGGTAAQLFLIGENLFDDYRPDRRARLLPSEILGHQQNGLDRINTLTEFRNNPAAQPTPRQLRLGLQIDF